MSMNRYVILMMIVAALMSVQACGKFKADENTTYPMDPDDERRAKRGKLTGEGGLKLFSSEPRRDDNHGLGVNGYLWKATLDTVSFMPLASTDPHGGVIITDWYEDPNARGERFKVNVLISSTELRADALRVTVFKQKQVSGQWQDSAVSKETGRALEDKILTRARELRISSRL